MSSRFNNAARNLLWIRNDALELGVAHGGGHISNLRVPGFADKGNPFWEPPWESHEPENVSDELVNEQYGGSPEGRLLASILGHSLALDHYGAPSNEETNAGAVTHGNVGVLPWEWDQVSQDTIIGRCEDPIAQIKFSRQLQISGPCVVIEESVTNLCGWDRPFAWQQHVSLGFPFCDDGFWATSNCDRGTTHPQSFGDGASLLPASETQWPYAPKKDGGYCDYRKPLAPTQVANDFTGYRVSQSDSLGNFVAGNGRFGFALFYVWPRRFFPWMGVWDEKHARSKPPWNKSTCVRAYEFGASPYPLMRRDLISTPYLFDVPTYLLLPANSTIWVRYILGVFTGIAGPGKLEVKGSTARLIGDSGVLAEVSFPCACGSTERLGKSE